MMARTYAQVSLVFCIALVIVCLHQATGQEVGAGVGSGPAGPGDGSGRSGNEPCGISTCSALEKDVQQLRDSVKKLERVLVLMAELSNVKHGYGTDQSPEQTGNSKITGNSGPNDTSLPENIGPDKRWWAPYRSAEVGFHATRFTPTVLRQGETLVFNRQITNLGHGYNSKTGLFVCPRAGTYIFSFSLLSDKGSYIEASILKNNVPVFNAVSDNRNRNRNQGGGTIVLKLNYMDTVKVAMTWPAGGTKGFIKGRGFTTFSGYLLREE